MGAWLLDSSRQDSRCRARRESTSTSKRDADRFVQVYKLGKFYSCFISAYSEYVWGEVTNSILFMVTGEKKEGSLNFKYSVQVVPCKRLSQQVCNASQHKTSKPGPDYSISNST